MNSNQPDRLTDHPSVKDIRNSEIPKPVVRQFENRQDAFFQGLRTEERPRLAATPRNLVWASGSFAALAVFLLSIGFFNAPKPLYAQISKAVETARSLHAVALSLEDGEWVQRAEVWYERDRGVVEREIRDEGDNTRIDNGAHQWRYNARDKIAVKSRSKDPLGAVRKLIDIERFRNQFPEKLPQSKEVDGTVCDVYRLDNEESTWRMETWLDPKTPRILGWSKLRQDESGNWTEYQRAFVKYDVDVDPALFTPEFGPEVTVMEIDTPDGSEGDSASKLASHFSLEDALYQRTVYDSLIFAVHELKRVEGGLIYVVGSMRPTPETLAEIPLTSESQDYGDLNISTSWKRLPDGQDRHYQPCNLATLQHDGLTVEWVILIPRGAWPSPMQTCELSAYFYARGELQKRREDAGLDWYESVNPVVSLPLPQEETPVDAIASQIYKDGSVLSLGVWSMRLLLSGKPDSEDENTISHLAVRPEEIPAEQYRQEVHKEIERLRNYNTR